MQAPDTPQGELKLEARLNELISQMATEIDADMQKWGRPGFGPTRDFSGEVEHLRVDYLVPRRPHLFTTHGPSGTGLIPPVQVGSPVIIFGTVEFNPPVGIITNPDDGMTNQDAEYIELVNNNPVAVDISGWKLTGGVEHTLLPGTVIASGHSLYVSPHVKAFRSRTSGPTGGQELFVQGNYQGHLSSWGETIDLRDPNNDPVSSITYSGNPSDQQRYLRITEMMYHPGPGGSYNEEEYEYIELLNIGTNPLDLDGVKFTDGISFAFSASSSSHDETLIDMTDAWSYEQTDTDLPADWINSTYNDNAWPIGPALLYVETASLPAPKNTPLTLGAPTYYFRTHFYLDADPAEDTIALQCNTVIDDGAVIYLNGQEAFRIGMPPGSIEHETYSQRTVGDALQEGPFSIDPNLLVAGDNVIAVEVHQRAAESSDIVFGLSLEANITQNNNNGTMILSPGEHLLIVKNQAAFESRYGTGFNIAGEYEGFLGNGGENIKLEDITNSTILEYDYNDNWYAITDGSGFSLVIIDPNNPDLDSWDPKEGWRPSTETGGSPGAEDPNQLPPGSVVINELLAHSNAGDDWIELYNTTGALINIGGWFLSDSALDRQKYEIAAGTTIAAYDYIVFSEPNFNNISDSGCNTPFALSENGEVVYLQSGRGGVPTGYSEEENFDASEADIAFGLHIKSALSGYDTDFVAMSSNTPGTANAYPKVGPVVINEIMYHPQTNGDAEYVELVNISGVPVTLYDSANPADISWKLADEGGFDFLFSTSGSTVTIAAGERILLVRDYAAFDTKFGDPGGIQIFVWGPDGKLSNGGEKITLSLPGDLDGTERQYIRIDRVNYSDGAHPVGCDPWPTSPDGNGDALARKISTNYGNDVDNWQSGSPTPGL